MKLGKKPNDCENMEEIRRHIDELDREIIRLFSIRSNYVHEIVKFKKDEESVVAKDRKELVIRQRGEWAEELGLDKNTFSDLYTRLLQQNINEELMLLREKK